MYARVTRFTDCDPDAVARVVEAVNATEGPPEGVPSTGLKVVVDETQRTMVFVGFFETEADLRTGDAVLREMDMPGGVPGTRATTDMGEVRVERSTD